MTVAASPQAPVSDWQLVIISCGAGLIGGFVMMLMSGSDLTAREIAKRVLASAMLAPGIVALVMMKFAEQPTPIVVFGIAGAAGLAAYPLAELVPKLAPSTARKLLKRWLGDD